jgi:hypothetical protein
MTFGESLDMETQTVAKIILEMAAVDVKHLVERSGNVESCGIAVGKLLLGTHLLPCEPFLVRKGVFHLVTVFACGFRAKYRRYWRQLDFRDYAQRVLHLLLLGFQLFGIGEMLPAASSAYAEMAAERLGAEGGGLHEPLDVAFRVGVFLAVYLDVGNVSGCAVGYEHHHLAVSGDGVSFRSHGCYLEPFQQG